MSDTHYLEVFKTVLREEAKAILHCESRLKQSVVDELIGLFERLKVNGGTLIFCGVGKSGLIAQKIAATFSSLGLSSWFLHPTEALHGDIGRVNKPDAMVFLSRSGTTEEISKLFPYLNLDKKNLVAMVGNCNSDIAKKCHIVIDCHVEKEAGTNNLAPTTSSTVTLSMGDAMAVLYESWVGLSKEGFAKNHPGGLLGKILTLKVKALMVNCDQTSVVDLNSSMKEVLLSMTKYPTGICCVVDSSRKLLGIIVEGDIRRHLTVATNFLDLPVKQVMNSNPKLILNEALAYDALKLMEDKARLVYVLPVVDAENRLEGIIRLHDLMKEGLVANK